MSRLKTVLKDRSGQGTPMILAVVVCCLILACVTFEYMRLMIVAQGVRDSVQSAIVDVATENWDEAYCMELFGENVQIAAASHDLFAKQVNGQIYRPLVEKYIAGEKRL